METRTAHAPVVEYADPAELKPSKHHIRGESEAGEKLVQSIAKVGIINPLIGRWEDGELRLLDGVRRARASEKTGVNRIPVVVKDVSGADAIATSLTLNSDKDSAFNKTVHANDREKALSTVTKLAGNETVEDTQYEMGIISDAHRVGKAVDGVSGVGPATKEALANHFETRERLENATLEELLAVEGVGEKTARGIRRWLNKEDGVYVV